MLTHCLAGMTLLAAAATLHAAEPATNGARLYASCAGCHGTNGYRANDTLAELAGTPKTELVAAMRAFKSGAREATIMHQIAKAYSDEQIALIAEFLANQPRTAKK